ncbi:MAG TPA: helix-turn-helix transcriptional regulator [Geobacteraceae bacterium]
MEFNGQKIKTLREERGFTMSALAEKLGPTFKRQNIYAYEHGVCAPRASTLGKIAEVFGVDVHSFFE